MFATDNLIRQIVPRMQASLTKPTSFLKVEVPVTMADYPAVRGLLVRGEMPVYIITLQGWDHPRVRQPHVVLMAHTEAGIIGAIDKHFDALRAQGYEFKTQTKPAMIAYIKTRKIAG
ncbi:hypothetical protein HYW55_00475 [Candidatus Gottesmanbacteria bacterium]|nr:hypothetical protein [Candidatus Gottesmanbacteria bacterium]